MPNTHSTLTSLFSDIANAIRAKKGTSADIVADNFPSEIASIPSGGITPSGSVTLTEEDTYDVTEKATAVVDMSATRANLAEAVTAKGVDTLPTASFDTIATNIGLIEGGGGINVASAVKTKIVTVGANSVTNSVAALEYFGYAAPFPNLTIIALDAFTVNNEFGFFVSQDGYSSGQRWWRWRDNAINWPNTFNTSWDTRLVEGKKYLIIEW